MLGVQTLAAVAGSLELEDAGIDCQQRVAIECGTCCGVVFIGFHPGITIVDGNQAATVHLHLATAAHALGADTGSHNIDHAAIDDDAVVGAQAVKGRAVDIDSHARADADVVVAADAAASHGNNTQLAMTTEDNLSLAKEGRLLVLLIDHGIVLAVLQTVDRAVGQHDIERLAALVVDGGAVGVGDFGAVEQHLEALVAVELE